MYTNEYLENDVLHKDPVELICLLYSKAIDKLNQALGHLELGEIPQRSAAIAHTMEIILELQGALNAEQGGEVAENLARLYDYIQERLIEANAGQKREPMLEALALLRTLHAGWAECHHDLMDGEQASGASVEPSVKEAAEAREWTL